MLDFNGTQAAIRAGYSKNTANEQAAQHLAKLSVQEYLSTLKKKAADESVITKQQLLDELAKIAFFDIRKIYTEDSALMNVKDFDDDSAAAVAGLDVDELYEGFGEDRERVGYTKKVKLHNKIQAIERVSKMLGYDAPAKIAETDIDGNNKTIIPEDKLTEFISAINNLRK